MKAHFRGHKYAEETLKLLPEMPETILMEYIFDKIAQIGGIHTAEQGFSSP
jgi:putative transposase